ncbi:PCYOX1 [Scenedesmus sp. PABB004]|nr:PCYOX1 [Scenedesmus sp. PABB004]
MARQLQSLLLLVLLPLAAAAAPPPRRVAIVGGGVGGASAAHFLRAARPDWRVTLFERSCALGGRTAELQLDGRPLELGASIIHAQNHHVLRLAAAVNLTAVRGDDTGAAFGIWDGERFAFRQSGWALRDVPAALARYGPAPLQARRVALAMAQRFARVYELQAGGAAFDTPEALLDALRLADFTQQRYSSFLADALSRWPWRWWPGGGAARFAAELAGAVSRINYNQANEQLNAMAGLVSYLPAAAPEVYAIKEGNSALPAALVAAAGLEALHLRAAVAAVRREPGGAFSLDVNVSAPDGGALQQMTAGPFDAVVLATPLEGSGIALQGLPRPPALPRRTYQTTVTTFVVGDALRPAFFNVASLPPGDVFVTNGAATPFSVIASKGRLRPGACARLGGPRARRAACAAAAAAGQQLWKVFSSRPLPDDLLAQLFVGGSVLASKAWRAYPRFDPPERFAPFALAPGLCYINALESAASAMEVAAVAAANCAALTRRAARVAAWRAAAASDYSERDWQVGCLLAESGALLPAVPDLLDNALTAVHDLAALGCVSRAFARVVKERMWRALADKYADDEWRDGVNPPPHDYWWRHEHGCVRRLLVDVPKSRLPNGSAGRRFREQAQPPEIHGALFDELSELDICRVTAGAAKKHFRLSERDLALLPCTEKKWGKNKTALSRRYPLAAVMLAARAKHGSVAGMQAAAAVAKAAHGGSAERRKEALAAGLAKLGFSLTDALAGITVVDRHIRGVKGSITEPQEMLRTVQLMAWAAKHAEYLNVRQAMLDSETRTNDMYNHYNQAYLKSDYNLWAMPDIRMDDMAGVLTLEEELACLHVACQAWAHMRGGSEQALQWRSVPSSGSLRDSIVAALAVQVNDKLRSYASPWTNGEFLMDYMYDVFGGSPHASTTAEEATVVSSDDEGSDGEVDGPGQQEDGGEEEEEEQEVDEGEEAPDGSGDERGG